MSEQLPPVVRSSPHSLSPTREVSPCSSTQTAASIPATLSQQGEQSITASAPTTSNPILYPSLQPTTRSPPQSPLGAPPRSPVPEPSASLSTESSSKRAKLPCPNKLAQQPPLPPRIIQISPHDFNAFREVLEEYKLRNLLLVSESKLTTREDIIAHFK